MWGFDEEKQGKELTNITALHSNSYQKNYQLEEYMIG